MPVDGSEAAANAVRFGRVIAGPLQAEVTVLGVIEGPADRATIEQALEEASSILAEKGIECQLLELEGGPGDEIAETTREGKFDLVVLGASGQHRAGGFPVGATTYSAIQFVPAAVLVVRGEIVAIRRVLMLSGSPSYLENAIRQAGPIIKAVDASVTLYHVMPPVPLMYADLVEREVSVSRFLASGDPLARSLAKAQKLLSEMGVDNQIKLGQGLVSEEILREVRAGDYGLVVVGSAPVHGGITKYLMGNITRDIVNGADRPVLVARSSTPIMPRPGLGARLRGWIRGRLPKRT